MFLWFSFNCMIELQVFDVVVNKQVMTLTSIRSWIGFLTLAPGSSFLLAQTQGSSCPASGSWVPSTHRAELVEFAALGFVHLVDVDIGELIGRWEYSFSTVLFSFTLELNDRKKCFIFILYSQSRGKTFIWAGLHTVSCIITFCNC